MTAATGARWRRLAVLTAVPVALATAAGALIPQGESAASYAVRYGPTIGELIVGSGADDFFRTPVYRGACLLLIAIMCFVTVQNIWVKLERQKGTRALARLRALSPELIHIGLVLVLVGLFLNSSVGYHRLFDVVEGESIIDVTQDVQVRARDIEVRPSTWRRTEGTPLIEHDVELEVLEGQVIVAHETIGPSDWLAVDALEIGLHPMNAGFAFRLFVETRTGFRHSFSVPPWVEAIPIRNLGATILPHGLTRHGDDREVNLFVARADGSSQSVVLKPDEPVDLGDFSLSVGGFQPFVTLSLVSRPADSWIYWGTAVFFVGLVAVVLVPKEARRTAREA
jgi:hypothetical protein